MKKKTLPFLAASLVFLFASVHQGHAGDALSSQAGGPKDLGPEGSHIESGGRLYDGGGRLMAAADEEAGERVSTDSELITLARSFFERGEMRKAEKALTRLIEEFPSSRFRYEAHYLLGRIKYVSGEAGQSRELLLSVVSSDWAPADVKGKAQGLIEEMDSVFRRAGKRPDVPGVGALVPLSGPYAQYGDSALRGILLAAGVFGGGGERGVEVFVEDAGPDPAKTEAAAQKLSENPAVFGLVGPLFSSSAEKAASSAERKSIPLIALSQKEIVAGAGGYVFRNSLTPASQASVVARYAYFRNGAKRFAMLYPQNSYGTMLAEAFRKEVQGLGATIVAESSYKEATTDFSRELKYLFGVTVKERKEGRKTVKEFKSTVQADALYIPDNYEEVVLILPYLEYFGIKGVRLLGSNGWNFPALIREAGKEAEGAVFADAFFPGSPRPGSREFTGRFEGAYAKTPGVLEANSHDAAAILISSISAAASAGAGPSYEGVDILAEREAVRKRLRERKDFVGASGPLSFDITGEAVRRPFLLTVRGAQISEIEDAP